MPSLLRLDLAARRADALPLPPDLLRRAPGGVALAAELLGPHSGDLVIAFAPLVGTPLTSSAKFAVAARSPLTGRFNDSLASGAFALRGRGTGHLAFQFQGACDAPAVVMIDETGARFEPAGDLWGREVSPAAEGLEERFGPGWAWGIIGPAGENGVRFASVHFGGRTAGRGGLGAVLGAKNVKAVGVRGTRRADVADPAGVVAWSRELHRRSFLPAVANVRELGSYADLLERNRALELVADAPKVPAGCVACSVGCDRLAAKAGGGKRMEAESFAALGAGGVGLARTLSRHCDELGMDTISAGGVLALALRATPNDLGATPRLLGAISGRLDIGDILADGVARAADRLGIPPEEAAHVGGLEVPSHDVAASLPLALGFAVNARGGDHNRAGAAELARSLAAAPDDVARAAADAEDRAAVMDSLILCNFLRGAFADMWSDAASMLAAVVGGEWSADDVRAVARRAADNRRRFNLAAGVDDAPSAWFRANAGVPDALLADLTARYRRARGWSPAGVPESP